MAALPPRGAPSCWHRLRRRQLCRVVLFDTPRQRVAAPDETVRVILAIYLVKVGENAFPVPNKVHRRAVGCIGAIIRKVQHFGLKLGAQAMPKLSGQPRCSTQSMTFVLNFSDEYFL